MRTYAKDMRGRYSRLKFFAVQFPLLYEYSIPGSNLTFKIGPIFNLNAYSSLKTAFTDSSGNENESFSKVSTQQFFTIDGFANLSFSRLVGMFVRYSPMKVMKKEAGVNFHALTVGITIGI